MPALRNLEKNGRYGDCAPVNAIFAMDARRRARAPNAAAAASAGAKIKNRGTGGLSMSVMPRPSAEM